MSTGSPHPQRSLVVQTSTIHNYRTHVSLCQLYRFSLRIFKFCFNTSKPIYLMLKDLAFTVSNSQVNFSLLKKKKCERKSSICFSGRTRDWEQSLFILKYFLYLHTN